MVQVGDSACPQCSWRQGRRRQTSGGHLAYGGGNRVEATALGGGCCAEERQGQGSLPSFLHQTSEPPTSDSICRAASCNPSHLLREPLCDILWTRRQNVCQPALRLAFCRGHEVLQWCGQAFHGAVPDAHRPGESGRTPGELCLRVAWRPVRGEGCRGRCGGRGEMKGFWGATGSFLRWASGSRGAKVGEWVTWRARWICGPVFKAFSCIPITPNRDKAFALLHGGIGQVVVK